MNDDMQNPVQSQIDAMVGSTPATTVPQPQEQQVPVQPEPQLEEENALEEEALQQQAQPAPQETYVKDGRTITADELEPGEVVVPYTGGIASPGVVYSNAEVDPQTAMTGKQYLRFKKVKPYELRMPDGKTTITDTLDAEKARYQYLALGMNQKDPADWYGYNPITPWRPTQVGSFFRSAANTVTSVPFDLVSLGAIAVGAPETAKASQEAYTKSLELHPGTYYLNIPERKVGSMIGSGTAAALGFIGTGGVATATKLTSMAGKALAMQKATKAVEAATKATDTGVKATSRAKAMKAFARADKFDKAIAKANLMPLQLQKVGTGYNWYMSSGEGASAAVDIYEDALSKGVSVDNATVEALLGGGLVAAVGQAPEFVTGVTGALTNVSLETAKAALRGDRAALKSLFWNDRVIPAAVLEAFSEVGQDAIQAGFTGEELDAATEWGTAMLALVMAGGMSAIGKNRFVEGNIQNAEQWKTDTKLAIDALRKEAEAKGVKLPKGFQELAYAMVDDPSLVGNLEELVQKGYMEQIDKMNDLTDDQKQELRETFNNPDLNVSQEAWNALDTELDGVLSDSDFTVAQKEAIKSIMHGFAVHGILSRTISSPAQLLQSLQGTVVRSSRRSGTTYDAKTGGTTVEINTNAVNQLPQNMQGQVDTKGLRGNQRISAEARNNAQNKDEQSMEQSGVVGDAIHELIGHFLGGDRRKTNAFINYFQKMTEALANVYPEGNKKGKLSDLEAEEYRAYAMQMSNKFVAEVLGLEGQGAEMLNFFESAMLARQANVEVLQNYVKALKTLMEQNATMVQAMIANHEDAGELSASIKQFAKTGDAGALTAKDLETLQRVFRSGLSDANTKLDLATLIDDMSTYEQLSDRLKGQYEAAMAADRKEAAQAKADYLKRKAQTDAAKKATEGVASPVTPTTVLQAKETLEQETAAPTTTEPMQDKGVNVEGTEYKLLTKTDFSEDTITNPRKSLEYEDEYLIDQAVHGNAFSKEMLDRYSKSVGNMFAAIPGGDQYLKFARALDYKKANVRYTRIYGEDGSVIGYDAKYYGPIPGGEITEANVRSNTNVPTAQISSVIAYGVTIERMRHNDNKTKYAMQGAIDIADVVESTFNEDQSSLSEENLESRNDIISDFKEKMYASASKMEEPGGIGEALDIEKEALQELSRNLSNEELDRPIKVTQTYFPGDSSDYQIPKSVKYKGKQYKFYAEETKNGVQPVYVPGRKMPNGRYSKGQFVYGFFSGEKNAVYNVDKAIDGISKRATEVAGKSEDIESVLTDSFVRTQLMDLGVFDNPNMPGTLFGKPGEAGPRYSAVTASYRKTPLGNKVAKRVVSMVYSSFENFGNIIMPSTTYETTITMRDFIDGAVANIDAEFKELNPYDEAKKHEINKKDKNLVATAEPSVVERDMLLSKYVADVYKKKHIKNEEQVLQLLKDAYREDYASWEAYKNAVQRSIDKIDEYAKSTSAQIDAWSFATGATEEQRQSAYNVAGETINPMVDRVRPHAKRIDYVEGKEAKLDAKKAKIRDSILFDPETQKIAETTLMRMGVLHGYYGQDKFVSWGPVNTAERNIEDMKTKVVNTDMGVVEGLEQEDESGNVETSETLTQEPQAFVVEAMQPETYGFQGDELDNALRITGTRRENFNNVVVPETAKTQVEFYEAYLQVAKEKIQERARQVAPVTKNKNIGLNTQASLAEFRKSPENQLYEIGVLRDAGVAAQKAFSDRFAASVDYLMEKSKERIVTKAENVENEVGFVKDLPIADTLPISDENKKMPMIMVHGNELKEMNLGDIVKMYYDGEWISGIVSYRNEGTGSFMLQGTNANGDPVEHPIVVSQLLEADDAYRNPVFVAPIVPLSAKQVDALNEAFEEKIGEPSLTTKTKELVAKQRAINEEVNYYSANPEELAMTKFAVQGDVEDLGIDDTDFLAATTEMAREADYYDSHITLNELAAINSDNPSLDSATLSKFDTPETSGEVFARLSDIAGARETMDNGPKITMSMFANSRIKALAPLTGGGSVEQIREEGSYLPNIIVHGTVSELLDNMTEAVNKRKYKSMLFGVVCASGPGRSLDVAFGNDTGLVTNVEAIAQKAQDIRERETEHNMKVVRDALNLKEAKEAGVKETYMDWNIGRTMDSTVDAEIYGGRTRKITRGEVMNLYAAKLVEENKVNGEFGEEFEFPIKVINGGNAIYSRLKQTYTNADQLIEAMPKGDKIVAEALLRDSYAKHPDNFTLEVGDFDKMTAFGYGLRSKNYRRLSAAESINPSIHLGVIDMFNAMDKHNAAVAIRQSGVADYYKYLNGLFEIGTYTSVDALADKFDLVIATDEDRAAGEALIEKSRALNAALESKLSPKAYEAFKRQLAEAAKSGSVLEDDLPVSNWFTKWWDRLTRGYQANALFAKPKNAVLNTISSYMRTGALTTGTLKHNTVDLVNAIAHLPEAIQYAKDFPFLLNRFQRNQIGTEFEKAVDTTAVDSFFAELARECANNKHMTRAQLAALLDKATKKLTEYGVGYSTAGADFVGLAMSWYNVGPKLIAQFQAQGETFEQAKAHAQEMFQWQTLRTVSSSNYATRGPLQKWMARHHLEAVCAFLNDTLQSWASLAENVHQLYNTTDQAKRDVIWRTINSNLTAQAFYISVQAAAWSALASMLFGDGLSDEEEKALQQSLVRETVGQLTGIFGAGSEYIVKPMTDSLVFGRGSAQTNIALSGPVKALQELHNGNYFSAMANAAPAVNINGITRIWDLVDAMGYVFEGGEATKLGLEQIMGFSKSTAMKQLGQKETKSGKIVAK